MIKGVLYTTAGTRRSVIALDAKTGELIWSHSLREGERAANAARQLSGRGVSYWTDGRGDDRIIYVTTGYRLVELNAKTGAVIASFGTDGMLDLKVGVVKGNNEQIDLESGEIGIHATPTVVGDVVIVGSSMREGATVPTHNNTKGLVRAFDVRDRQAESGASTPFRGRASSATRPGRTIPGRPTATPACGRTSASMKSSAWSTSRSKRRRRTYYGGHRPGNNLFAESLVAVDLKTGVRKWHFQFVHHPIWNWDMTSAPILADINVNGRARQGGRRSPASRAGSTSSIASPASRCGRSRRSRCRNPTCRARRPAATQPHPPDALRYARNFLKVPDDLIDFTPELRAQALEVLKRYKVVPSPFAPGVVGDVNGIRGAIVPGTATNWPGGGYDPETHIAFMPTGNTIGRALAGRSRRASSPTSASCPGVAGPHFRDHPGPGRLLRRRHPA